MAKEDDRALTSDPTAKATLKERIEERLADQAIMLPSVFRVGRVSKAEAPDMTKAMKDLRVSFDAIRARMVTVAEDDLRFATFEERMNAVAIIRTAQQIATEAEDRIDQLTKEKADSDTESRGGETHHD